jgi:Saxitoxin biosynthesis operon protein SxtJ
LLVWCVIVTSEVPLPSDRKFGFLFVLVFALFAAYFLWRGGSWWPVFAGLSALTLVVSLVAPQLLHPLNRAWMAFGLLLGRIITPIVLGLMFFVIFTPVGILMRLFGRDALRLKLSTDLGSYWVDRSPPGPDPQSLREQG